MPRKKVEEFMIVNRRSKKALQAAGTDNGAAVEQCAPNGSDAQLWAKVKSGSSVKFVNKQSGRVLDVVAEGVDNGVRVQVWDDVDGESQQWQVVNLTVTYKKLQNVRSGRVLDIADMSDEDGAPAQIWDDVEGDGQQWKLVPVEEKPAKAAKKAPAKAAAKKAPAKKTVSKTETVKKAPAKKTAAKAEKAAVVKAEAKVKAPNVPEEKAPAKKPAAKAVKTEAKAKTPKAPEEKAPASKAAPKAKETGKK